MATQSPFPGMDPYLEQHWRDVHQSLVTYARDQLQPQLPKDLRARVEERVYLATEDGPRRNLYPDVRVSETGRDAGQPEQAAAVAVVEPLVVEVFDDPFTE